MKNLLFFLLPILFVLNGCNKNDPAENDQPEYNPPSPDAILIRVKNISAYDYESVFVSSKGAENVYGNIPSGQYTDYKEYEFAYQYAYIKLKVNGIEVEMVPFDYVGAIPLENGHYTYEVTADGTREHMGMAFKKD